MAGLLNMKIDPMQGFRPNTIHSDPMAETLQGIGTLWVKDDMQARRDARIQAYKEKNQLGRRDYEDKVRQEQYARENAQQGLLNQRYDEQQAYKREQDEIVNKHKENVLAESVRSNKAREQASYDKAYNDKLSKEQKQKLEHINKQIDRNEKRINTLSGKEMLTDTEQEEIENLKLENQTLYKRLNPNAKNTGKSINDIIGKYKTQTGSEETEKPKDKPAKINTQRKPKYSPETYQRFAQIMKGKKFTKEEQERLMMALEMEKYEKELDRETLRNQQIEQAKGLLNANQNSYPVIDLQNIPSLNLNR